MWAISFLMVSTFQKSMMDCPSKQLLFEIQKSCRQESTPGGTRRKQILTILRLKNEFHRQLQPKQYMKKMGPFVQFPYMLSELWPIKLPWQKLPIWAAHHTYSTPLIILKFNIVFCSQRELKFIVFRDYVPQALFYFM